MRSFLLSTCLILTSAISAQKVAAELRAMVELPSPAARRKAADRMATKAFPDLAGWVEAMTEFGEFAGVEVGPTTYQAALWNGRAEEDTEIFVHVPANYSQEQPASLLLMEHGTGSTGRNQHLRWLSASADLGMIVISPSESADNSGYRFSERERQLALSAIRWARLRFNIDEDRIYLSGISRGGHMCWDLALRYPDLVAGIAPMIGGPRLGLDDGQNNLRYLENIADLPIRDLQGLKDDPLLIANLELAFEELQRLGNQRAELVRFPELGHGFDFAAVDWPVFFGGSLRDSVPLRIVRVAARRGEGRAFWAEITGFTREVQEEFRIKVKAHEWNRLDDSGRRRLMHSSAIAHSARLEIDMEQPGHFTVQSSGVRTFRLLLTDDMVDAKGRVHVLNGGKTQTNKPRYSRRVLLREFAERFDRNFLPTMEFRSR